MKPFKCPLIKSNMPTANTTNNNKTTNNILNVLDTNNLNNKSNNDMLNYKSYSAINSINNSNNSICQNNLISRVNKTIENTDEYMSYDVVYWENNKKKNKIAIDGYIKIKNNKAELFDLLNKKLSSLLLKYMPNIGDEFIMGYYSIEITSLKSFDSVTAKFEDEVEEIEKPSLFKKQKNNNFIPKHIQPIQFNLISEKNKTNIAIDPYLLKHLRPHQVEGFMLNCVLGKEIKIHNDETKYISGCILADSMGLGKTLQTISVIWSLLKQGQNKRPTIKRAMIITPATLVENWQKEFLKWLGTERLKPLALTSTASKELIHDFLYTNSFPVLIISYELLRNIIFEFDGAEIGMIVCDEGHRLKNSIGNKTIDALSALQSNRRIILTGTPIQNNLEELFAMCDFVCPNILGTIYQFKNQYSVPIELSRNSAAAEDCKKFGENRWKELQKVYSEFILRRDHTINSQYLPSRYEFMIFCKPSHLQITLYCQILNLYHSNMDDIGFAFSSICLLKKLCAHPYFICDENNFDIAGKGFKNLIPENYFDNFKKMLQSSENDIFPIEAICLKDSGKLDVLDSLLNSIKRLHPSDKVIVVSNFTSHLDLIQIYLKIRKFKYVRLDGSTKQSDRLSIVNRFNKNICDDFVFLLSAKAGGVGLNLIGANRLIMYDGDWNPATDEQVMGRIWRDGQLKNVFNYRLATIGTIEETIFQRQIKKGELLINSEKDDAELETFRHFSTDELSDIFSLKTDITYCHTYDLFANKENAIQNAKWKFIIEPDFLEDDDVLNETFRKNLIIPCVSILKQGS